MLRPCRARPFCSSPAPPSPLSSPWLAACGTTIPIISSSGGSCLPALTPGAATTPTARCTTPSRRCCSSIRWSPRSSPRPVSASPTACSSLRSTQRPWRDWRAVYLLGFAANILPWVSVFWFGNNDGVVAALVIGAVLARRNRRMLLCGLLLGLATLDKYYPALLI